MVVTSRIQDFFSAAEEPAGHKKTHENKVDYTTGPSYDFAMKVRDWERDIVNRQRNIVFPDTMLNEVRLYRNIIAHNSKLNPVQRAGVFLLAATFLCSGVFSLAGYVVEGRVWGLWMTDLVTRAFAGVMMFFGFILAYHALTAASAPKPPRWWLKKQSRRRI